MWIYLGLLLRRWHGERLLLVHNVSKHLINVETLIHQVLGRVFLLLCVIIHLLLLQRLNLETLIFVIQVNVLLHLTR